MLLLTFPSTILCLFSMQAYMSENIKPLPIKDEPKEIGQYLGVPSGTN